MIVNLTEDTSFEKDRQNFILSYLNPIWSKIKDKFRLNKKAAGFVALLITIIAFLGYINFKLKNNLSSTEKSLQDANTEIAILKTENTKSCEHPQTLGNNDFLNIEDFTSKWNVGDFFKKDINVFCPKNKGGNNYQRIFFNQTTLLARSKLNLKFKMIDEKTENDYQQRFVIGLSDEKGPIFEYDIPTKNAGQTVNFRGRDDDNFSEYNPGESLPSPIKKESVINLSFSTSLINTDKIAVNVDLGYFSDIDSYGSQNKAFSRTFSTEDTDPENSNVNLYIGSYKGGCIKILGWDFD